MQFRTPLCILLLTILTTSCGNNTREKKSAPLNCYQYANAGDTIILKLVHVGESITGTLVYKMPGKNTFTENGQVRFTDIHNLQFADIARLEEIPCQ